MLGFLMIPFRLLIFVWDRITFLVSVWCSAHGLFNGVPLANIQRDWHALLHGLPLYVLAVYFVLL